MENKFHDAKRSMNFIQRRECMLPGRIFLIAPALLCFLIVSGCSDSIGPGDDPLLLSPVEAVAKDITLYIYSNGWGNIIDSMELESEGEVVIDVYEENPYGGGSPDYYIYALADNYYTEIHLCDKGETIDVDLDSIPQGANAIAATLIVQQVYFLDYYIANTVIQIEFSDGRTFLTTTDEQGRFGLANVPRGICTVNFVYGDVSFSEEIENSGLMDYKDMLIYDPCQVDAPVLYLYPENETDIEVKIDLHERGFIIESEPEYNNGWSVRVTPEGIIDGSYEYLFYEAIMSVPLNNKNGWILDGSNLESELRELLKDYGLIDREIDDFIEFWLPIIEGSSWYAAYPQDADELIALDITPTPDNVLRVFLSIRPLEQRIKIDPPPGIKPIERSGFTVVEWGVVGWPEPVGH
jgi:hypothetical protein